MPIPRSGDGGCQIVGIGSVPALRTVISSVDECGTFDVGERRFLSVSVSGKGFGDRERLDVEVEECGQKVLGMAGVRLRHRVLKMLELERDEGGRYEASFHYSEGGPPVVVTWDLEAKSRTRMTGSMTIMGRHSGVEAELREPGVDIELKACERLALKARRDRVAESESDRDRQERRGWRTDPESCTVDESRLDRSFPTQPSFELAARTAFEGELVHRQRCCDKQSAWATAGVDPLPSYTEWLAVPSPEKVADEQAARTAELATLDAWLDDHCLEDEEGEGAE